MVPVDREWLDGTKKGLDVDRRPEMDRREVALELVKLGATKGFIVTGEKPELAVLLRAYTQAFKAVIESVRAPMVKK